jgi:hypothetical protein
MYQGQPYVSDIIGLKRLRDNWHCETPNHKMMVDAVNSFARHKQTTDAKDRVLGILGLCPPEILESLVLDADFSVTEAYIQFARWSLALGRFQEILITLDYAHHFSSLPSWGPNLMWNKEPRIHWDIFSAGYRNDKTKIATRGMGIPEPDEVPETRWLNPHVLELPATIAVDQIHAVLGWDNNILTKKSWLDWSRLLKWETACLELSGGDDPVSGQDLSSHATTLVADRMEGLPRFVLALPYPRDPMRCYMLWKTLLVSYAHMGAGKEHPSELVDYSNSLLHVCEGQSYFVTTGGGRGISAPRQHVRETQ